MSYHAPINESIRLSVEREVSVEIRSALATFCRRNGFPHLFFEILEPLLSRTKLILALGVTERPWPPKGIGSLTIEAVGIAMIGSEHRAYLTPVLADFRHATNLGLSSAVTKQLLEAIHKQEVTTAGYLVRQGDGVLERVLEQAGFGKSDFLVANEYAEYIEYSAAPQKILQALGLSKVRLGDILALAVDGQELDRWSRYQFVLGAALAPYLSDHIRYAPLLPSFIDVVATLPPGGVPPGTVSPEVGPGGPGEL